LTPAPGVTDGGLDAVDVTGHFDPSASATTTSRASVPLSSCVTVTWLRDASHWVEKY